MKLSPEQHWLFWEVDPDAVDVERDCDYILARTLEKGRMVDVAWAASTYGLERIHSFLRDVGHPELSPRTIAFWKAFFHADAEQWKSPPHWRRTSSAPWHN